MNFRQRVVVYVNRPGQGGRPEVVVFRDPKHNNQLQCPAGGVEDGESLEEAARREVAEEVGLELADTPRRISASLWRYSAVDTWCIQHFFSVAAPADLPDRWNHVLQNERGRTGSTVHCGWLPAKRLDRLIGGLGNAGMLLVPPAGRLARDDVTIRDATRDDLPAIIDLRNHAIATGYAIYSEEPLAPDSMDAAMDAALAGEYPLIVAEVDGRFAGYAGLSQYNHRTGYRYTAENSVYVSTDMHGRGVGGALLDALLARAADMGLRTILSRIDSAQNASLALHLSRGFAPVGIIREAGYKFDSWRDVVYLQKLLTSDDAAHAEG